MWLFNWGGPPPVSIEEAVATFQEIAVPLVAKGNFDEVNRLYAKVYTQAMKGRKAPLEEMRAKEVLSQALQDVLMRSARERRHYFDTYGSTWWRNHTNV